MKHKAYIESKICQSREVLLQRLELWNREHAKVVFTNGCFDLLHKGHVDYLSQAADLGDKLIVALNTDHSVSRLKGPGRPIQNEDSRLFIMASLTFVDAVILFDEETPYELIRVVQPDVLVKGSDYKPEDIVGYDIVVAKGGEVKTIDFLPGYSTTSIEKKIRSVG
ncbi:MAG: D-glycero-beta-D-manno-heptose 1-phosphate adenylyltransferase [Bacteroidia bacterium]|jgi:rfaE bifunctional protein nucleotidyltransferase chain/domain